MKLVLGFGLSNLELGSCDQIKYFSHTDYVEASILYPIMEPKLITLNNK